MFQNLTFFELLKETFEIFFSSFSFFKSFLWELSFGLEQIGTESSKRWAEVLKHHILDEKTFHFEFKFSVFSSQQNFKLRTFFFSKKARSWNPQCFTLYELFFSFCVFGPEFSAELKTRS